MGSLYVILCSYTFASQPHHNVGKNVTCNKIEMKSSECLVLLFEERSGFFNVDNFTAIFLFRVTKKDNRSSFLAIATFAVS